MCAMTTLEYKWWVRRLCVGVLLSVLSDACAQSAAPLSSNMNQVAERYVKLVLRVGQHDADYVDAYYGDASWKPTGAPVPLEALVAETAAVKAELRPLKPLADPGAAAITDDLVILRY